MRNLFILIALLISLCLLDGVRAAEQERDRTINTSGESTVYVQPNEVVIRLGVETWHKQLAKAKAANDSQAKELLAAIREVGVEEKHIQADVMQVQIDYPSGGAKSGIDGYYCRRAYAITLKDTSKFEQLIDSALNNGANYLMGFEFRTTDLRKYRDQARSMAIKAAKEKAVALAGELQMNVGSPRTINEGGAGYWGYSGSWGWGGGGYGQYMAQNSMQQAPVAGGEGGETLPLGQIAVRAQVNVIFDITPNAGDKK